MTSRNEKIALLAVDVQNDFCPGGALAVKSGNEVVPPLNLLRKWVLGKHGLYFATRDWHPSDSTHFETWPKHCVANTPGAQFYPTINLEDSTVISKGIGKYEDGYSGFEGKDDSGHNLANLLDNYREKRHLSIIIGGLATDYCVKATALDAARLHDVSVYLPIDAIRAVNVNPEDSENAIDEMMDAKVKITTTKEILSGKAFEKPGEL